MDDKWMKMMDSIDDRYLEKSELVPEKVPARWQTWAKRTAVVAAAAGFVGVNVYALSHRPQPTDPQTPIVGGGLLADNETEESIAICSGEELQETIVETHIDQLETGSYPADAEEETTSHLSVDDLSIEEIVDPSPWYEDETTVLETTVEMTVPETTMEATMPEIETPLESEGGEPYDGPDVIRYRGDCDWSTTLQTIELKSGKKGDVWFGVKGRYEFFGVEYTYPDGSMGFDLGALKNSNEGEEYPYGFGYPNHERVIFYNYDTDEDTVNIESVQIAISWDDEKKILELSNYGQFGAGHYGVIADDSFLMHPLSWGGNSTKTYTSATTVKEIVDGMDTPYEDTLARLAKYRWFAVVHTDGSVDLYDQHAFNTADPSGYISSILFPMLGGE